MNSIPVLIRKWRALNGKHDESFTGNNSEQTELCWPRADNSGQVYCAIVGMGGWGYPRYIL